MRTVCFIFLHFMREFLSKRWLLFLVLVVFIICKVPHLSYPFYWDESWPYAKAVKAMYMHGPSLMPGTVDPELSRGHPLFFHAAAAIWMDIFGTSHVAMHSFALLIAVLFLILIYEAGLRLFNRRVAVISLLLVATQVVFFIQSSFLLFEVLVGLLVFASLYFYVQRSYLLAAIALTALFYTKESGLIAGFVIGIDALIGLFDSEMDWKIRLKRILAIAVPCILIAVFFLLQKKINGWYILPLYNDLIEHKLSSFWYNFRYNCISNTFYLFLRYYYYLLILLLGAIAAIKNRDIKYLVFLLPFLVFYRMVCGKFEHFLPGSISTVLAIAVMLYTIAKLKTYQTGRQQQFILLSCAFIICFFCFSCMNFFSYRYLIPAIVPVLFFTAVLFDMLISRTYPFLYVPVLLFIVAIGYSSYRMDQDSTDVDPGAFTAMNMQQSLVDYLEKNKDYDKVIGTGSFLDLVHLTDPATGYLRDTITFKKVSWFINDKTTFAIFNSNEYDPRYTAVRNDSTFRLVYRFQKDKLWGEIYERK